ncbi:MAG: hypothetical protein U1E62_21060 [Alsobacter sp.]
MTSPDLWELIDWADSFGLLVHGGRRFSIIVLDARLGIYSAFEEGSSDDPVTLDGSSAVADWLMSRTSERH